MILGPGALAGAAEGDPGDLAVLIPCHEPGERLGPLLDKLLAQVPPSRVLLVDDGSRDGSAEQARERGIEVFAHGQRQGKGAALVSGFVILGRRGHPWILSLDADGQHDPSYIPAFVEAARRHQLDLVLGDRMAAPGPMPWDRRLSNTLSSRLIAWRLGNRPGGGPAPFLRDSQCGFRLYRTALLARLHLACRQFDLESELLLKAVLGGARAGSVPVPCLYTRGPSGIRRLGDSLRFLRLLCHSLAPGFPGAPSPEEQLGSL